MSSENLDKTQGLVEETFQEIRNTNKSIPIYPGQPCTPDHLQVFVLYFCLTFISATIMLLHGTLMVLFSLVLGSCEGCTYKAGSQAYRFMASNT